MTSWCKYFLGVYIIFMSYHALRISLCPAQISKKLVAFSSTLFVSACCLYVLWQYSLMDIAKIYFSGLVLGMFLLGAYFCLNYRNWLAELIALEQAADLARDDAMFNLTAYRASLVEAKLKVDRLNARVAGQSDLLTKDRVINAAGSVLKLILQREQSLLKWGTSGWKLVQTAWSFFKNK